MVVWVDPDDVDDTHALVEGVQGDRDETYGNVVDDRDERVPLVTGAALRDRIGLPYLPVGMQAQEDLVAQHLAQGLKDRFPGAKRHVNDRSQVTPLEGADIDHGPTIARAEVPTDGCRSPRTSSG